MLMSCLTMLACATETTKTDKYVRVKHNGTHTYSTKNINPEDMCGTYQLGEVLQVKNKSNGWYELKQEKYDKEYIYSADVDEVSAEEMANNVQPEEGQILPPPTPADTLVKEEVVIESPSQPNIAEQEVVPAAKRANAPFKMLSHTVGKKTYNVADIDDVSWVYREAPVKENCFAVISKQEFRLYVYEKVGKDTVLAAHYPVCYARYPEGKTKTGDMRTPDCSMKAPFYISQIANASSWKHDFKDGRGSIPAYGDWFIRLDLSKSNCPPAVKSNRSIGIHGCGGNGASVPGMDSEGCIRLRDKDIRDFKTRYAHVGMKIVVKPYAQAKLPFELKAEKKQTDYHYPVAGYKAH